MSGSADQTTDRQMQRAGAGNLECRVQAPGDLTAAERTRMHRLMLDYYENVDPRDFERDLAEKEWVIVVGDSRGDIRGFTTVMRLMADCGDEQVVALFSGDTVLEADVWGAGGWVRAWGHLAAGLMQAMHPQPLYLLLLTATHRTYRFLPAFFKEYYPQTGVAMPAVYQRRLEALVRQKFAEEYDAARGIVRTRRPMSVRQESLEIASKGIDQKDAAFFAERNPGYLQGDYLVCITDLSPPNQTRLGKKLFSLDDV
jgi:hypothetical protein